MNSVWIAAVTGCLLAVAGCSQPHVMAMQGDEAGSCGYGMGAGMMAGERCNHFARQDRHGRSPGMMGGYGMTGLDLTSEQRAKIADIRTEFGGKQRALMEQMYDLRGRPGGVYRDGPFDEQAARKSHDAMAALRQQMFENALEARKRIDGVLSPQQREQIGRRAGGQ